MKKNKWLIIACLLVEFALAQNEKTIKGKIIIKDATALGVIVLNLVNEKEAVADTNGDFAILAKPDDVLVFYATNLDKQRKIVEQNDYDLGYIEVQMTSKIIQLDDVEVVSYNAINAVSLGILSKPAIRYTPAQRRLYSSQSSSLDTFINFLSGRRDVLHDDVATERKEFALAKLEGLFDESFYTETLKIDKEFIKAFHYYIVENQKFTQALQGKNQFLINLLIIDLSREYKALHNYDKN